VEFPLPNDRIVVVENSKAKRGYCAAIPTLTAWRMVIHDHRVNPRFIFLRINSRESVRAHPRLRRGSSLAGFFLDSKLMKTLVALVTLISTFVSASLLAQAPPAASTQTPASAANQPTTNRTAPPVQRVNRKLPEGPGLTHHVLKSSAFGHEVGCVVWTQPDYDAIRK
jgi:hypothetical protein